jgi:hypothetical protein
MRGAFWVAFKRIVQILKHQKEWSKFGASKRMVKICSTKKNGQNLKHQKEWLKFGASENRSKCVEEKTNHS